MIARVITTGVAVVRGVGGRRGRARLRAAVKRGGRAGMRAWLLSLTGLSLAIYQHVKARDPKRKPRLGYRERRRRAKLRRRARDRWVRDVIKLSSWAIGRQNYRDPAWRGEGWWSTPEGRRRWTEERIARKKGAAG